MYAALKIHEVEMTRDLARYDGLNFNSRSANLFGTCYTYERFSKRKKKQKIKTPKEKEKEKRERERREKESK